MYLKGAALILEKKYKLVNTGLVQGTVGSDSRTLLFKATIRKLLENYQ